MRIYEGSSGAFMVAHVWGCVDEVRWEFGPLMHCPTPDEVPGESNGMRYWGTGACSFREYPYDTDMAFVVTAAGREYEERIAVHVVDHVPVFLEVDRQFIDVGEDWRYTVPNDVNVFADSLGTNLVRGPRGLEFLGTGLHWTPDVLQVGRHRATVEMWDEEGNTDETTIEITVRRRCECGSPSPVGLLPAAIAALLIPGLRRRHS